MAVVRLSPLRRRHLPSVQVIAGLLEPLDRAIRNLRVLIRRAAIATWRGERVPAAYLGLLSSLAEVTDEIAGELQERRIPTGSRRGLSAIAEVSAVIDPSAGLSSEVMRAQIRSMVVDLLDAHRAALRGGSGVRAGVDGRRGARGPRRGAARP